MVSCRTRQSAVRFGFGTHFCNNPSKCDKSDSPVECGLRRASDSFMGGCKPNADQFHFFTTLFQVLKCLPFESLGSFL